MIGESVDFKNAAHEGRLNRLNTGAGRAVIQAWGGTRPATGAAGTGDMIAEITLTDPAGSVSAGTLVLTQEEDGLILVNGTPTWCRVFNGDGTFAFDMGAGLAGSGEEAIFTTTTLYAGGGLRLVSCVLA